MPLITTTRAKMIASLSAVADATLEILIDAATQRIENYLNRKIEEDTFVETRNGDGSDTLFLNNFPVGFVHSIEINDETWVATGVSGGGCPDGWVLNPETGELNVDPYNIQSTFRRGRQNVVIIYTAGYDPVPEDIQEACAELVECFYNYSLSATIGKSSESEGDYSVAYNWNMIFTDGELPAQIQKILGPYKNIYI